MALVNRRKPRPGEKWMYLTGQTIEIIDVNVDPYNHKEQVVYRKHGSYAPTSILEMDDFMASLKEKNKKPIPYFRKAH